MKTFIKKDPFSLKSWLSILTFKSRLSFHFLQRGKKLKCALIPTSQIKEVPRPSHSNGQKKYILKDKTPIPCEDEDLWKAWRQENNKILARHSSYGFYKFKIEFMERPLEFPQCDSLQFFKVVICSKNVVTHISFHATWEMAERRYYELIAQYERMFH